jgi:WD40 repeat protein
MRRDFSAGEEMIRLKMILFPILLVTSPLGTCAQEKEPLELFQSIPLPELKDGDFDHFAVDLVGNRLFSTAEENGKVLVLDLKTNKLIHSLDDLKAPHSMLYRADRKELFVVDGDLGKIKIYDTDSYKPVGSIEVREGADSSTYDSSTKYLYVVTGGDGAHLRNSYITIIDTTSSKQVGDIKIDCSDVDAMVLEKAGPRLFIDIKGNNTVGVFDRNKHNLIATWPIPEGAKKPITIAFDETNRRLFVGTRDPGRLIVLDSDSGKVVANLPAPAMVDDLAYDPEHKRIYFAGTEVIAVFQQRDPDHYAQSGHIATSFRAKTAILVPELNRYYLAVPHHENQGAEVRVYSVMP